jgi:uncharacterized protein YfbU (UPF0304 family)
MKLSIVERFLIASHLQNLANLNPQDAQHYDHQREAIENGYEYHYSEVLGTITEDVLVEEDCQEVLDILHMFDVLEYSASQMSPKPEIKDWQYTFRGFDGNNEPKQLRYAEWFCTDGRYAAFEARMPNGFNSHSRVLDTYRRQLQVYRDLGEPLTVTKEQLEAVAAAAIHPDHRK